MTLFVSFEGGEGSGKTTQVGLLLCRLEENGHPTVQLREPGMTPLGNAARDWLKRSRPKKGTLTEGAELFLFAAARAEMVAKVLKPALGKATLSSSVTGTPTRPPPTRDTAGTET